MYSCPKQLRITNDTQLQELFSSGKSLSFNGIILKYINEKKEFKIGFSAPKRLHQSAVTRSLIKRRMRESFRLQQQLLGSSFSGIGYFIYNDKKVRSSQEIYTAFTHLLMNWKNSDT